MIQLTHVTTHRGIGAPPLPNVGSTTKAPISTARVAPSLTSSTHPTHPMYSYSLQPQESTNEVNEAGVDIEFVSTTTTNPMLSQVGDHDEK